MATEPTDSAPYLDFPITIAGLKAFDASLATEWRSVFATASGINLANVRIASMIIDGEEATLADGVNAAPSRLRARQLADDNSVTTRIYYGGLDGATAEAADAGALLTSTITALKQSTAWVSFVTSATTAGWSIDASDIAMAVSEGETAGAFVTGPPAKRPPYKPFGDWLASDVGGFIGTGIVLIALGLMYLPTLVDKYKTRKAGVVSVAPNHKGV